MSLLFSKFEKEQQIPLSVRLQTATPEQVKRVRALMALCCFVVFGILSWAMASRGIALPLALVLMACLVSGILSASVRSHERGKQMWAYYGFKSFIPGIGLFDMMRGRRARQAWETNKDVSPEEAPNVRASQTLADANLRSISPRQRRKLRNAHRRPLNNLGEPK